MRPFFYLTATIILSLTMPCHIYGTEVTTTTIKDQTSVEVTVYNSNIGLVKDQRRIGLLRGLQELRFMDVAAHIIPSSVSIRCLSGDNCMEPLEQNYEYDLISPAKLLDKYIGKEVKLYTKNPYTDKEEVISAVVLANNKGQPVFKIGKEITFNHPGRIIFPEIPKDLISKPTLLWQLRSEKGGKGDIELAYLTNNINWLANYVLTVNEGDDRATLTGWVTITNNSGTTFENAALKLVAGDVHRVEEPKNRKDTAERLAAVPLMQKMKEEDLLEYHIYTLQRRTTLKDNQTKQILMVEASGIPLSKEYIFQEQNPYYFLNRYTGERSNTKVEVYIGFQNKREQNLGIPLPKGTVRVYKYDSDKSLQFIGENRIDHTPKGEKVSFKVGNAFDIAAERKQTEWTKVANNVYESAYEIVLRNQKKEDITVKVVEKIPGTWKVLSSSHQYTKHDSATLHFMVPVMMGKEARLKYAVRVEY